MAYLPHLHVHNQANPTHPARCAVTFLCPFFSTGSTTISVIQLKEDGSDGERIDMPASAKSYVPLVFTEAFLNEFGMRFEFGTANDQIIMACQYIP